MGVWASGTSELLTGNGTALGLATVASNAAYKVGATAWLTGTALAARECVVVGLVSTTGVTLRFKKFQTGMFDEGSDDRKEVPTYGLSDISAYTLAAAARLAQEAGIAPNPL